jgi:hypothetical protein
VPASAQSKAAGLRLVATTAPAPAPSRKLQTQVRYASLGGAGLFLLAFLAFRRRSR